MSPVSWILVSNLAAKLPLPILCAPALHLRGREWALWTSKRAVTTPHSTTPAPKFGEARTLGRRLLGIPVNMTATSTSAIQQKGTHGTAFVKACRCARQWSDSRAMGLRARCIRCRTVCPCNSANPPGSPQRPLIHPSSQVASLAGRAVGLRPKRESCLLYGRSHW
jgi:hypothetical protein